MKFEIRKVVNGWIIKSYDGTELVGQDSEENETDAFVSFLREIVFHWGPTEGRSKYSNKRIHIVTLPGRDCASEIGKEYLDEIKELKDHLVSILKEQKELKEERLKKVQ